LESYIFSKIKKRWSPEQITESWIQKQQELCKPNCCNKERLSKENTHTKERLSKDTIYNWIYTNHSDLVRKYFRRKGKKYRNRKKEQILNPDKYQIQDRRMIDERPKEVHERKRIGDWE
jgi:IS30 family transposase